MSVHWSVFRRKFRECFRVGIIVAVSILTLFSVAAKGDQVVLVEGIEITAVETFVPPSPSGVLLISAGIIFVGWLRRRKMGETVSRQ